MAGRIASALDTYETQLRGAPKGIDKKTGLPKTMWDFEGKSVIAARKWNERLATQNPAQIPMSAVFLEVIQFVAKETGFTVPPLP